LLCGGGFGGGWGGGAAPPGRPPRPPPPPPMVLGWWCVCVPVFFCMHHMFPRRFHLLLFDWLMLTSDFPNSEAKGGRRSKKHKKRDESSNPNQVQQLPQHFTVQKVGDCSGPYLDKKTNLPFYYNEFTKRRCADPSSVHRNRPFYCCAMSSRDASSVLRTFNLPFLRTFNLPFLRTFNNTSQWQQPPGWNQGWVHLSLFEKEQQVVGYTLTLYP
jgi:hypothetical protein